MFGINISSCKFTHKGKNLGLFSNVVPDKFDQYKVNEVRRETESKSLWTIIQIHFLRNRLWGS